MTCHSWSVDCVKAEKYGRKRAQRYRCQLCGKRYSELQDKPLGDVRLPDETVRMILHCHVERNSIRGTARLRGVEKRTVLRIFKLAGENCESPRITPAMESGVTDHVWSIEELISA